MPVAVSKLVDGYLNSRTYPHRCVQRPCDLIVLLQSRAASQNLRQPELADCALHMPDLSLGRRGCSCPLRWLAANTADHICMGESLGSPLVDLGLAHLSGRLRNAGMK